MGRGVSSGGGQSSLGYLFGDGEAPKPSTASTGPAAASAGSEIPPTQNEVAKETPQQSPAVSPPPADVAKDSSPAGVAKEIPAGIPGNTTNNYFRAEGQNCGNFLTDRPTTKVHAAPGGGSSLDYLFGGNEK